MSKFIILGLVACASINSYACETPEQEKKEVQVEVSISTEGTCEASVEASAE